MKRAGLSTCLLFFLIVSVSAMDTGKNPTKAMVLSAAFPGGGQFYNESYYKAIGVISLQGFFVGRAVYHNHKIDEFRDKIKTADGDDLIYYESQRNRFYNRRRNDFWWLGTILFLSVVDAFVDSHLYNFDQKRDEIYLNFSDDLSGVGIEFRF